MKNYELMYILAPGLDEEAIKAAIESLSKIISANGGSVTGVNEWGSRDLAYPIKKQTRGYYVVVNFSGDNHVLDEFDRIVKLDTRVLRFLITVAEN